MQLKVVNKCITILIIQLLFISSVISQSAYRFNNYTINDGLSQSSVTTIIQDDNYSLWIGTQDGLNRFDGKTFEVFTSDDNIGLESSFIKCSVKTKDGKLWFGTMNGLTVYNPSTETFQTYNLKDKTAFQIESITVDENNNLWIGSYGKGLYFFNTETLSFSDQSSLINSKKINQVYCAENGDLFLFTEDQGLYRINKNRTKTTAFKLNTEAQEQPVVNKIKQFFDNSILFGTDQGVFQLNLNTYEVKRKFENIDAEYGVLSVSDIYLQDNDIWFISTSNKGLFTITSSGKVFNNTQDIFQKNALIFNDINFLFKDASGVFWAGTNRGLSSFDPLNEGIMGIGPSGNLETGIPSPNVWCFAEDIKTSCIYIGTDLGVSKYNRQSGKFEQYYRNRNLKNVEEGEETTVLSLYVLNDKQLLVGCMDGFFRLDIYSKTAYSFTKLPFENGLESDKHNKVYTIVKYKDQQFFLGTNQGLFCMI